MKDSTLVAASTSLSKLIEVTNDFFKEDHSEEAAENIAKEMQEEISTMIQDNELPDESSKEELENARLKRTDKTLPKEGEMVNIDDLFDKRHESSMTEEDLDTMKYQPTKKQAPSIRFDLDERKDLSGNTTVTTMENDVQNIMNVLWFHKREGFGFGL